MFMRKHYLDNIRWITVVIVVIYHVLYMYNAEGILGGLGKITNLTSQPYDIFMYFVYPWFMPVLFMVAGISSRLFLERHTDKEFVKSRTQKLLVPSTIGLFAFQFIQGYVSMSLGTAFSDLAAGGVPKLYRSCRRRSAEAGHLPDYGRVRKRRTVVCPSPLDLQYDPCTSEKD